MKLVFPGGEHAPADLAEGVTFIGSDPACAIVLAAPGVAARHCEIRMDAGAVFARPLDFDVPTVLNGRQIAGDAALGIGDLIVFGHVGCQVNASERTFAPPPTVAPGPRATDEGRTRVRAALPKYMLRGVSGTTFGKTFAVTDNAVIGRQPDCEIPVPAEEISRHHVRLRITPQGVHVEDMGSANGTYVNDRRIQSALLKPGEELRLDTVRFLLLAPGMDARQQSAATHIESPMPKPRQTSAIALIVIVLAAIAIFALRSAGVF